MAHGAAGRSDTALEMLNKSTFVAFPSCGATLALLPVEPGGGHRMSNNDDAGPRPGESAGPVAGYDLDPTTRIVTRGLRELSLSETDFRLFRYFLGTDGRLVTREELRDAVWGDDAAVDLRTMDARVSRLRKALRRLGDGDPIETLRGLGYRLKLRGEG